VSDHSEYVVAALLLAVGVGQSAPHLVQRGRGFIRFTPFRRELMVGIMPIVPQAALIPLKLPPFRLCGCVRASALAVKNGIRDDSLRLLAVVSYLTLRGDELTRAGAAERSTASAASAVFRYFKSRASAEIRSRSMRSSRIRCDLAAARSAASSVVARSAPRLASVCALTAPTPS
jgi:hypothetical protein